MANFQTNKIEVFTGINDSPIAPTEQQGGNGSHLISQYNSLIDDIEDEFNQFDGITAGLSGNNSPTFKNRYYFSKAIEIPAQGCLAIQYPANTFMSELTMGFQLQLAGQANRTAHTKDVYCFSVPGRIINGNSYAVIASGGVWASQNITTASWSGTAISSVPAQFFLDIPDTLHFMVCNSGDGLILGHVFTNSYSVSIFAFFQSVAFTV